MAAEIFNRVAHGRTADEVVEQIEQLIVQSVLRSGDRLPAERDLARRLDVSRPVLRHALKALETRGLLKTRKGGGTFVADIAGEVFAAPLVELIAKNADAVRDYLEYRREIEGTAAAFAARRATQADRAMLESLIARMRLAHEAADFGLESELDVEFHNSVGECAHNIVLLHTLRACYRLLSDGVFYNRSLIYEAPDARDMLLEQHVAIADAIFRGDASGARLAAQDHIDFVAEAMTQAERAGDRARIAQMRLRQRTASAGADVQIENTTLRKEPAE